MIQLDPVCLWCGEELPIGTKATAKYCGVNHRMRSYRQRKRDRAASLQRFDLTTADLDQLRRHAALTTPETYRPPAPTVDTWTLPAPPPRVEPELVDEIDCWFSTPIRLVPD
jgi:hypothetical protein